MREDRSPIRADAAMDEGAEPTLVTAIERVAQAAVEVLDKRFDLIQLEVRAGLSRSVAVGIFLLVAFALLVIAWIGFMAAGFVLLRPRFGDAGALAIVAGLNVVLGALAAGLGARGMSRKA